MIGQAASWGFVLDEKGPRYFIEVVHDFSDMKEDVLQSFPATAEGEKAWHERLRQLGLWDSHVALERLERLEG